MRPGRRESRRHKDSYRPGNVEEVHERRESVLSSLSLSFPPAHLTRPPSRPPPRARTRRVGVPFRDLRRFNRAINLTPCCNNTSRRAARRRRGKNSQARASSPRNRGRGGGEGQRGGLSGALFRSIALDIVGSCAPSRAARFKRARSLARG